MRLDSRGHAFYPELDVLKFVPTSLLPPRKRDQRLHPQPVSMHSHGRVLISERAGSVPSLLKKAMLSVTTKH
jgi:hypothetical protein